MVAIKSIAENPSLRRGYLVNLARRVFGEGADKGLDQVPEGWSETLFARGISSEEGFRVVEDMLLTLENGAAG